MTMRHYKKIVFIGDDGAGKTSLTHRLQYGAFNPYTATTIGASYAKQTVHVDGVDVNLHFWDTAGRVRFNVLLPMFIRGAKIVLVCFDRPDIDVIQNHLNSINIIDPSVRIILVMTKIDQASFHDTEKMEEYALNKELSIFLTSALSGVGVQELFEDIARYFISMDAINTHDKDAFELESLTHTESLSSTAGSFTQCCSIL